VLRVRRCDRAKRPIDGEKIVEVLLRSVWQQIGDGACTARVVASLRLG
jgi:hypothetical protein